MTTDDRRKQLNKSLRAARSALAKIEKALESVTDESVCCILTDFQLAAESCVEEIEEEIEGLTND